MGNWNDLSIREKANLIGLYMDGGILDLPSMRKHYNSFAGGGNKKRGLGIFRRRASAPELPEIDMSSVDADISDADNRLDYYLKESEAKKYFNSTTPADRYYDRLEKQDTDSKKFLSELYSGRSSMFPELNMSGISSSLGQGYKIDSGLSDKTAGYYNPYTGINYAPYSYNTSHYYMGDAPVHERTHSLGLTDQENKIKSYIDTSYQDYDNNGKPYYGFLRDGVQYDPYLDDPSEIYARRNAFLQYMKNYGNTYSGETKDGRIINDLTPDTTSPIGGRWIEAIKSNGNAHEIDTFSTPVDMFDERYWDDSFNERGKTNNFLERYSPEFIMFLLNGVASNATNKSLTENNNIAAYGKELNKYSPSQSIKDYIKKTEAFRPNWYKDGNGVPTVGYGFTGEYYKNKYPNGMTKEQADEEFERVVAKFSNLVKTHTPNYDLLSQNQKDALLSYMYNVGPGNYTKRSPKFQQALRDKDWNAAASHMDIGYNDKRNPGLKKRRDYERGLFLNGVSELEKKPDFNQYNYYSAQKGRVLASPEIPMAGNVSLVGMPSLYYAQSSPYKDVDFSKPLPELTSEPELTMITRAPRNRKRLAKVAAPPVASSEDIINDLFATLKNDYDVTL